MAENGHNSPGLSALITKFARTGLGALQNRGELLSVEWQEEKARLTEVIVWAIVATFLAVLGLGMLTAFIIFLFPAELRVYALAGFAVLYLAGAIIAWVSMRGLLTKQEPFAESIAQIRKDAACLDSSK
jgi:uncharacterized membrane protein YqjE